jgi:hypothetical protein
LLIGGLVNLLIGLKIAGTLGLGAEFFNLFFLTGLVFYPPSGSGPGCGTRSRAALYLRGQRQYAGVRDMGLYTCINLSVHDHIQLTRMARNEVVGGGMMLNLVMGSGFIRSLRSLGIVRTVGMLGMGVFIICHSYWLLVFLHFHFKVLHVWHSVHNKMDEHFGETFIKVTRIAESLPREVVINAAALNDPGVKLRGKDCPELVTFE